MWVVIFLSHRQAGAGFFFINFSLSSQSCLVSSFLCLTSILFLFYFLFFYICYFLYSYPCPPIRSLRFSSFMFLCHTCFSIFTVSHSSYPVAVVDEGRVRPKFGRCSIVWASTSSGARQVSYREYLVVSFLRTRLRGEN